MGAYLKSWHRAGGGPSERGYAWRLVEAVVVGLLLAALALAWSEQHVARWSTGSADSAVSESGSQPARNPTCPNDGVDAVRTDHHGGAVVTAC
jgi:hypothetical protein